MLLVLVVFIPVAWARERLNGFIVHAYWFAWQAFYAKTRLWQGR